MSDLVERLRASAKAYRGMLHDAHANDCEQAADRIEALESAGERYMDAVKALFAINPETKACYAEGSPTKDQETYERFVAFNNAGKAFAATLNRSHGDDNG